MEADAACLWKAANDVDDGVSDASTIALAIIPICGRTFQQSMNAMTRNMGLGHKVAFIKRFEAGRLELATSAVVRARAARRQRSTG
jgi:hypothetical protein